MFLSKKKKKRKKKFTYIIQECLWSFTYVLVCLSWPYYLFCSYFCAHACMLSHRCEFQNEMFNHQPESLKWWHNLNLQNLCRTACHLVFPFCRILGKENLLVSSLI